MHMKQRTIWALLLVAFSSTFAACTSNDDLTDDTLPDGSDPAVDDGNDDREEPAPDPAPAPDPITAPGPTISRSYTESNAELVNPERGYYTGYDLLGAGDASRVRTGGKSLAITIVRLDDYRDRALDAAVLAELTAGFAAARTAGIKVVLRFTYNASLTADASKSRILGHLDQLKPLLVANADVIAVMQAGFIGAWGEWHSSTNGLGNDADRTTILNAILAALPASRQVAVRTPMFKGAAFGTAPLTAAEGWSGSPKARVGHHNDCFLASASDLGTYASPVPTWMSYVATEGRYTAIGGETCALYALRTACAPAIAEMAEKRWSYLNAEYNTAVVAGWDAGGCGAEIKRRLGYRFVLDQVVHTQAVAPGGELALRLDIKNRGFASPFNKRPVEIVLTHGDSRMVARLSAVDARRWAAGETTSVTARLRIPATITPGTYTLALRLPDDAASLAGDKRYAIRLANDGVWNDASGDNTLTTALQIDPAATGPRDAGATVFAQLP